MKLPVVSGREIVKVLSKIGYAFDHQTSSHMILRHTLPPHQRITVPDHREIAKGTLLSIIRHAGISRDDLLKLLKKT